MPLRIGSIDTSNVEVRPETVAERYLLSLRAFGIERLFVNAGSDFAPLVEAYARLGTASAELLPKPMLAAHENLAMGMAHGAYLMTGRPQAVMFHVNVGTANAACAALNAAAERVPLLITAGKTPLFERGRLGSRNTRVTWSQEMYDQASLVREAVKWEYELRDDCQVADVVGRALAVMMTEPKGPAYLTLPREVLAEPAVDETGGSAHAVVAPTAPHPAADAVEILADRIADAEMPVISSIASGSDPESVGVLAELCDRFGIGYVEDWARYLNLPSSHPLHLGYELAPVMKDADVLCFVESDVPWVPDLGEPRADTFVAHCGVDPSFGRIPIRTYRSDLSITTAPTALYRALAAALEDRADRIHPGRRARIGACASSAREARARALEATRSQGGSIDYGFLSAVLGEVLHENCVLFNEYFASPAAFSFERPRSYFLFPAAAGLGWALPAALGAKLVAPERTMVAAIGDGTYMFSNPVACHHASRKHDLPVLTVICNNARWNAVDITARMVYPRGRLASLDTLPLSDLSPTPSFEKVIAASGGYGELVTRREDLRPAIARALRVVEVEKREALVNVLCG